MRRGLLLVGGLGLLAGCGGDGQESAQLPSARAEAITPDAQDAPAKEVAARAEIDCATVKGQSAPKGQPADDILGIREGMSADQVRAVLACKNTDYVIQERTQKISLPDDASASEILFMADSGLDKMSVSLIGPPGQEKVVHSSRTVEYVEGSGLPVAAIEQELQQKYGEFDQSDSYSRAQGYIIHARGGQRIGEDNSLYRECKLDPDSHRGWGNALTTKCGEVIRYRIQPNDDNENVAFRFTVGVTNPATASKLMAQASQAAEQESAALLERAKDAAGRGLDL